MMTQKSAEAFAQWLLENHPDIFIAIAKKAINTPQAKAASTPVKLGDISSVLSSIGTGLSTAVSGVGSWLSNSSNIQGLTGAASSYFNSQAAASVGNAQNAVFQTQLLRAQSGMAPAPINYSYNSSGQPVPMYNGSMLSPSTLQTLVPTFLQKYGLYLAIGAAGIALIFILRR